MKIETNKKDKIEIRCTLNHIALNEGIYIIRGRVLNNHLESDWPKFPLGKIHVLKGDYYETGNLGFSGNTKILIKGQWEYN